MRTKKRGQVWVETVTYTLIAFILISLVLYFAKPKIQELQDKTILEQSTKMLKEIDSVMREVGDGETGNKRKIELTLKDGSLEINPVSSKIVFELESRYKYSEPGEIVQDGNLIIVTEEKGKYNKVNLTLDYTGEYTLTQSGTTETKIITKASNPYNIFITNKGGDIIDIEIQ